MTSSSDARAVFRRAAIEWAAGARGQGLVDAAAQAIAAGVDSPTLRVLAGAPHATAEQEATELAPDVFSELGLDVAERFSADAIIAGAHLVAADVVSGKQTPRAAVRTIYSMYRSAGYPGELAELSGLDDWYDMVDQRVVKGRIEDVDRAVVELAQRLVANEGGS